MSIFLKAHSFDDVTFGKGTKEHAIGGIGRLIKKQLTIYVYAKTVAGPNNVADGIDERITVTANNIQHGGKSTLTREQGDFVDDGMVNGDSVSLVDSPASQNLTIDSVTSEVVIFKETISGFSDGPSEDLTMTLNSGQYTAVEIISAWNTNNNQVPLSLVDGTAPRFLGKIGFPLEEAGFMSGYLLPRGAYTQLTNYIIESTDINIELYQHVGPFFEDYTQCDGIVPNYFLGTQCVNWYTKIKLLKNINNPNESREITVVQNLGNTGYLNENYNQGENPWSIENVKFKNFPGNKEISGIQTDKPTEITFDIKSSAAFVLGDTFQPCFTCVLEDDSYKENKEKYIENVFFENCVLNSSTGPGNGSGTKFLQDGEGFSYVRMNFIDSSTVQGEIRFNPGPKLRNILLNEEKSKFLLWVNTEIDAEADIYNTKEVPLEVACGDLITDPNLDALLRLHPWQFFEHDELITQESKTTYNGYLTDDVFAVQNVGIKDLEAEITNVKLGIYVNISGRSGESEFALEEFDFKTEGLTIDQISSNINRNYKISSTDNHTKIQVKRDPSQDGAFRYVQIIYAWRPRHEYWIKNENVSDDFYDNSLPHDGKNNKWDRFDVKGLLASGEGRIFFRSTIDTKSKLTDGVNTEVMQTIVRIGDFNEAMDNTITWTSPTQVTRDQASVDISPTIQSKENTILEYDFVGSAAHGGIANYYGEIKAENFEEGNPHEISTEKTPISGILIPNAGETQAVLTEVDSTTLRLSASVDHTKLTKSKLSIYPRIGRKAKPQSFSFHCNGTAILIQSIDSMVIEMGDEAILSGTFISHTFTLSGTKLLIGTGSLTTILLSDQDLVEWIDFSRMVDLEIIDLSDNADLKSLFLPNAVTLDILDIDGTGISELDLRGVEFLPGDSDRIDASNCPNLSFVEFGTPTNSITNLTFNDSDLGYFDIKPAVTKSGMSINLRNNQMTSGEVDMFLIDIDSTTETAGTITINGDNEAPGAAGLAAKSSLEGKSWTVNVTA